FPKPGVAGSNPAEGASRATCAHRTAQVFLNLVSPAALQAAPPRPFGPLPRPSRGRNPSCRGRLQSNLCSSHCTGLPEPGVSCGPSGRAPSTLRATPPAKPGEKSFLPRAPPEQPVLSHCTGLPEPGVSCGPSGRAPSTLRATAPAKPGEKSDAPTVSGSCGPSGRAPSTLRATPPAKPGEKSFLPRAPLPARGDPAIAVPEWAYAEEVGLSTTTEQEAGRTAGG